MESLNQPLQTADQNLFELQIDHQSTSYLSEIARWGKFLSIVGFIMCGLIVIGALFAGTLMTTVSQFGGSESRAFSGLLGMGGALISFIYIAFALLYFFPCLYLFNFSTKMQAALRNNDQVTLNTSFGNLKSCFKFVGILTIIILSLYALAIVFGIFAAAFFATH